MWKGALLNHPSWNEQMLWVFKTNSLKLNADSHNNTSWYTDTDGFLEHSPSREILYYKELALQKTYIPRICFLLILEGGEREGEDRETLIGCLWYMPQTGTKPTTQVCALAGDQTCNLLVHGLMFNPTESSGQVSTDIFYSKWRTLFIFKAGHLHVHYPYQWVIEVSWNHFRGKPFLLFQDHITWVKITTATSGHNMTLNTISSEVSACA